MCIPLQPFIFLSQPVFKVYSVTSGKLKISILYVIYHPWGHSQHETVQPEPYSCTEPLTPAVRAPGAAYSRAHSKQDYLFSAAKLLFIIALPPWTTAAYFEGHHIPLAAASRGSERWGSHSSLRYRVKAALEPRHSGCGPRHPPWGAAPPHATTAERTPGQGRAAAPSPPRSVPGAVVPRPHGPAPPLLPRGARRLRQTRSGSAASPRAALLAPAGHAAAAAAASPRAVLGGGPSPARPAGRAHGAAAGGGSVLGRGRCPERGQRGPGLRWEAAGWARRAGAGETPRPPPPGLRTGAGAWGKTFQLHY